jgi:tRNA dimethylallyltransferase
LVAETQALLKRGLVENHTALQALGYRQVVEYVHGARSLPETVELVKTRTRQFAKRQMTWFRRQLPVKWIHLAPGQPSPAIAEKLAGKLAGLS